MSNTEHSRLERAEFLRQTGRRPEAVKELRNLINDSPEFVHAYARLALILAKDNKSSKEPIFLAQRAITLEPEYGFGYYSLAFAFYMQDRYNDSEQAILRAIELEEDNPDYWWFHGAMLSDINRRDAAKASLLEALRLNPEHQWSLTLLARLEAKFGNVAEAKRIAAIATKNLPEDEDAHIARGYALLYSNRPKEAFEAFREALRLEPNNEDAQAGMLTALKTQYLFYRTVFRVFSMLNRISPTIKNRLFIGLLIACIVVTVVLCSLSTHHPEVENTYLPIFGFVLLSVFLACIAFYFINWFCEMLSFFLLLFNRWGRLTMNGRQKAAVDFVIVYFNYIIIRHVQCSQI